MLDQGLFSRVSRTASQAFGHPFAFSIAVLCVVVWALLGPAFHFGDSWQLTINTGTTIVTFLMVFLIQNSQNRHSDAIQLKLDELIRAVAGAHNYLMNLEEATDEEVAELKRRYRRLHDLAVAHRSRSRGDEHGPSGTQMRS